MQTAVNPQTGERVRWDGEKWVKIDPKPNLPRARNPKTGEVQEYRDGKWSMVEQAPKPDRTLFEQISGAGLKLNQMKEAGSAAIGQGVTLGLGDEIAGLVAGAGAALPGGKTPREAYHATRDSVRSHMGNMKERNPKSFMAGELFGGLGLGALAAPKLGATKVAQSLSPMGRNVGAGVALGGTYGAASADGDAGDRLKGGAVGAGIGLATPLALRGIGAAASPFVRGVGSLIDPKRTARSAIAKAMQSVDEGGDPNRVASIISDRLEQAQIDGNDQYALMDAMGLSGKRLASTVARQPGTGRAKVTDFLNQRQVDQSSRVAEGLDDALGLGGETAEQAAKRLKEARRAITSPMYKSVPDQPIDISRPIQTADQLLSGVDTSLGKTKTESGIRNLLAKVRSSDATRVGSKRLTEVYRDTRDDVSRAYQQGRGNFAADMEDVNKTLRQALEEQSPGFRDAQATYNAMSKPIDALADGPNALRPRSRIADTLGRYSSMTPDEQAAYRVGAGDQLLGPIENAAPGVNTARPFESTKRQKIIGAMQQDDGRFLRNVARENEMFDTRVHALGGSRTADNLADMMDDPTVVVEAAQGNMANAAKEMLRRVTGKLNGLPETARNELADYLVMTSPNDATRAIEQALRSGRRLTEMEQQAIRGIVFASSGN